MKKSIAVVMLLVTVTLSAQVTAKELTTEQRLQRLERLLEGKGLVDMLTRLDELQKEVQILRGEVELQSHNLEGIKKRQRDLYVDIDTRLLKIERMGGSAAQPVTAPAVTPDTTGGAPEQKEKYDLALEQKAYQQAFDLLRDLRYDKSIVAFRKFLQTYPDGRYAHIAQYWIGEANYAQRNFKDAIQDYQTLIKQHTSSPKLAEAMLKIAYSYYELKDLKKAESSLQQLINTYPNSTEAGQGRNLLKKVKLQLKGKS